MPLRTMWGASRPRVGFGVADAGILLGLAGLVYVGVRAAIGAPNVVPGPAISLQPQWLPYYTLLSVGRIVAAYLISLLFALAYGYGAAHNPTAALVLLPLLDVLQSVPILSFLPVAVLSLTAVLPEGVAVELASILLIVTSQAWNMAFSTYQSFTTVPRDLLEAAENYQFHPWLRFKLVELPFAARPLIWNSMLSWAGAWFFLMAAETFSLGTRDFRLPGLGSYLQTAAQAGNMQAVFQGLAALVLTIVILDQIIWRPAITWAQRFRLEAIGEEETTGSWLYDLLRRSWLVEQFGRHVGRPASEALDRLLTAGYHRPTATLRPSTPPRRWTRIVTGVLLGAGIAYGVVLAAQLLAQVSLQEWLGVLAGVGATLLRVAIALAVGLLWTVPSGVAIGTNPRVASVAQPAAQVTAAIPATAIFPIFVVALVAQPGGLNVAAILLMLLGTQWYILFNVIAGVASIPMDLYYTAEMLRLGPRLRWTRLTLPAIFPYLVTGLITASGGAWNASIVAEYVVVAGTTYAVTGVGALIAESSVAGNYPLLLASTLTLIVTVAAINWLVWRPLYRYAAEAFRME